MWYETVFLEQFYISSANYKYLQISMSQTGFSHDEPCSSGTVPSDQVSCEEECYTPGPERTPTNSTLETCQQNPMSRKLKLIKTSGMMLIYIGLVSNNISNKYNVYIVIMEWYIQSSQLFRFCFAYSLW